LPDIFHAVDNRRNVGEAHGGAVAIGHNDGAVAVAGDQLIVRTDGVSLMRSVEGTFRLVDIGLAESGAQIFETHAVGGQSGGIDLDAHCGALAATDADKSYAGKLRNLLGQRCVREVFDFGKRERR